MGWGRGFCSGNDASDPAWACVEGTMGCKDNQTCFLGAAIIGECRPNSSVTFSCTGLDGKPVAVTKPLPVYTVCTVTNPCVELTSGFVCAQINPQTTSAQNPSMTIDGVTCKFE